MNNAMTAPRKAGGKGCMNGRSIDVTISRNAKAQADCCSTGIHGHIVCVAWLRQAPKKCFSDGLEGLMNAQAGKTFDVYQPFVESVVPPNKAIFASLVARGEPAVGVAMVSFIR
jgi:hypothetical protein